MNILTLLESWLPFAVTLCIFSVILGISKHLLFTRNKSGNQQLFTRQAIILVLVLISMIGIVISLPIPESTQLQILSLLGLLLSGLLAYSSTTVFSNLIAGSMMRFTQPFRTGDFIRADQYFGRVTERGLLDCEIQTAERELVSIPNSWLISRPVEVIRNSGTIVSSTLSLGYELHHEAIRPLLRQAANEAGLEEPYVHIIALGDFSVSYKVSGLLVDIKNLITTRSNLNSHILDCLHKEGIEIISPSFMNQRPQQAGTKSIPSRHHQRKSEKRIVAEDIVFDKAEEAEQFEKQQQALLDQRSTLQAQLSESDKDDKEYIQQSLAQLDNELEKMEKKPEAKDK